MSLWSAQDAALATGGKTAGKWQAEGVSIDTRTLRAGDLFVALADQRDGHDFVADALQKGASAALVSRRPADVLSDENLLYVQDVQIALEGLARAARQPQRGAGDRDHWISGKNIYQRNAACDAASSGQNPCLLRQLQQSLGRALNFGQLAARRGFCSG